MRWLLVSAVVLVSSVATSLGLLVTARGPMAPNPDGIVRIEAAEAKVKELSNCVAQGATLDKQVKVFRDVAAASKLLEQQPETPEEEPPPNPRAPKPVKPPKPKAKPPDFTDKAWPAAKPSYDAAVALRGCKALAEPFAAAAGKSSEGWAAIDQVAALKPAGDAPAQLTAARQVFAAFEKAPIDTVGEQLGTAQEAAKVAVETERTHAAADLVEQPLPRGILGREVAIAAGLVLSLIALLVSFFSLRATSIRRAGALVPYRKAVRPPERGLQAATILRLASEPNGGEPGLVLGAAAGGVILAMVGRLDADWYVAGVMGGLLVGLLIQIVVKSLRGARNFRERCLALAEIEKPAVPIILVLSTVKPGMEDEFLDFFLKLSPNEAANAVEKLASQAEEQILIAADAQALG